MVFDDATGCDLADETGGGFNLMVHPGSQWVAGATDGIAG